MTNSGGSFSNIMAMNLGRYKACPEFKTKGMYGQKKMKMYTSDEASNHFIPYLNLSVHQLIKTHIKLQMVLVSLAFTDQLEYRNCLD